MLTNLSFIRITNESPFQELYFEIYCKKRASFFCAII